MSGKWRQRWRRSLRVQRSRPASIRRSCLPAPVSGVCRNRSCCTVTYRWMGSPFPRCPMSEYPPTAPAISVPRSPITSCRSRTSRHSFDTSGRSHGPNGPSSSIPGSLSRPTLATITRLAAHAQVPTLHWGDMDAGGVRIFRTPRDVSRQVDIRLRPHMMDLNCSAASGRPAPGMAGPVDDMHASAIAGSADLLIASGLVHAAGGVDPEVRS